ncbi:MAG: SDR family oxidoreductase [Steroidobacteraceae bacterium]|jgi:meso-butanediol dehydrogenase/(S,S)-butanediol dehydrogenase/diacetyl reductase
MTTQIRERAIVTGATSGIGRAVAVRLAKRGAAVAVLGRNVAAAQQVAAEVADAGGVAFVAHADVSNAGQVQAAVSRFVAEYGGIDTVVASAGIALTGHVTDCDLADWDRLLATNLNGVFYLARYAIPELLKSRGTFTAISSDAGVHGACGYAAYCASKHAINGLIKCLALDYGSKGVRCNSVCPGFVETPMAEQLLTGATAEEVAFYKGIVPIGRFARPDEVAAAVAHLSSAEASYVNGMIYNLDGGSTAGFYSGAS